MKQRRWTDEQLTRAVAENYSIASVLRELGLVPAGGNYKHIQATIKRLGLDTSHFTGQGWNNGITYTIKTVETFLIEGSTIKSYSLKNRLIEKRYLLPECSSCKLKYWLENPIPLELHHINGIKTDNQLDNLELLCPNCHALTENYRGRNKARY